jgi:hypothetical protein
MRYSKIIQKDTMFFEIKQLKEKKCIKDVQLDDNE